MHRTIYDFPFDISAPKNAVVYADGESRVSDFLDSRITRLLTARSPRIRDSESFRPKFGGPNATPTVGFAPFLVSLETEIASRYGQSSQVVATTVLKC